MYIHLHMKCLLFLSDVNETWIFLINFGKILKYEILQKSVQWEPSCSMWTDRHDEANRQVCNFANMPQNSGKENIWSKQNTTSVYSKLFHSKHTSLFLLHPVTSLSLGLGFSSGPFNQDFQAKCVFYVLFII